MQTKFDIDDIVYIPAYVRKITIEGRGYQPDYRICPVGQTNTFTMTYQENELFTKEDILNGKAEESES